MSTTKEAKKPEAGEESKQVRFTAPVRRGLILVRGLLVDSFDNDATPSDRQVAKWSKAQQKDFNAAQMWLEQIEAEEGEALKAHEKTIGVTIGGDARNLRLTTLTEGQHAEDGVE